MDKQYYIKLKNQEIPVTEEIYRAYKRPVWREKKFREYHRETHISLDKLCALDGEEAAVTEQTSVEETVLDKLLRDELMQALANLTESERLIVIEIFVKGKSEQYVAQLINTTQQAVHKKKKNLLKKLREKLI